ncbi:colicin D domain-containing protein [Moraxella sp. ZJ142]|uniref:colicin D domain-containing protein n=1 Tax=Moraxella marmotae TaxID=3344520 RepID=UPI0035D4BC9C
MQLQLDRNFTPLTLDEMRKLESGAFDAAFGDDLYHFKRRQPIEVVVKGKAFVFPPKQLDAKFKHAENVGVKTSKKNPSTLLAYQQAIIDHLEHAKTRQFGQYRDDKASTVYYNDKTGVAVAFDGKGEFTTLFKLDPSNKQHSNFLKNGVLF